MACIGERRSVRERGKLRCTREKMSLPGSKYRDTLRRGGEEAYLFILYRWDNLRGLDRSRRLETFVAATLE